MKVVVIGGVAGGSTAACRIRRLNEQAEIIVLEKGAYVSFANCALPYYAGGLITDKDDLLVQTPQGLKSRYNLDVRVLHEATKIDRKKKEVTVKDLAMDSQFTLPYDRLVIATGAKSMVSIKGMNSSKVFAMRTVQDTVSLRDYAQKNKIQSAVVIGGGFIGVETAESLAQSGLKVTLLELGNQILPPLDADMATLAEVGLTSKGVTVFKNASVQQIVEGQSLSIESNLGAFNADIAVVATGVIADSTLAKECGLQLNERGGIIVDEHMRTSDENIYAAGDVVEVTDYVGGFKTMLPLAGPANKQGRVAADNICGLSSKYKGALGSGIVKIFDTVAAFTGMNEKTAKRLGKQYEKSFIFTQNHASYYPGSSGMWIKTLFNTEDGKILGAQIVGGEGADKRCDVIAAAIYGGMTAEDLTHLQLCYAPPFSSAKDPVNVCGNVMQNIVTKKVKVYHYHDVQDLIKNNNVQRLDVRTKHEYAMGHIQNFTNIPLDELRTKFSLLNKELPVYVHCMSGQRSYIACCILSGLGFNCYNLSGGYKLYNALKATL